MTRSHRLISWLLMLSAVLAAAACQPTIPPLPDITVVITAVDNEAALAAAVEGALTATAQRQALITETALALGGITLTPTPTPTATLTPPLPTATPFLSPTPTTTPTSTATPTLAPLPSNTPPPLEESAADSPGRLRLLHALRRSGLGPVEVYVDDVRVARGLEFGADSGYTAVAGRSVRVAVRPVGANESSAEQLAPPLVSSVVDVGAGASVSVVLADMGQLTPSLVVVREDITPLRTRYARLTVLQANSTLLRFNALVPGLAGALAYNMAFGDQIGPFDVPAGSYTVNMYDADIPDQLITSLSGLRLNNYVNHLLVLVPAADSLGPQEATDYLLFSGSTARTPADVAVTFINAAPSVGTVRIVVDDSVLVSSLPVGHHTVALPLSRQGGVVLIEDLAGENLYLNGLGPFDTPDDRIVVIMDPPAGTAGRTERVRPVVFAVDAPESAARAAVRLIHGLSGTNRTLDLELRATSRTEIESIFGVPPGQQESAAYVPVIQGVRLATASEYVGRVPAVFDVRVVLSGTQSVQDALTSVQMLAGGVYDFVVVPGETAGVARLLLIQPDVQVAGPGINRGDPQVVREQVEAALTALAPAVTPTSTAARTATPTSSPVFTNTPRPSNTPALPPPALLVDPVPPNAAVDSFMLTGLNLRPDSRYTISLAGGPEDLSGSTDANGSFTRTVAIPAGLRPGAYTVRVCVDCRAGGANQEVFAVFVVADRARTPTATPVP